MNVKQVLLIEGAVNLLMTLCKLAVGVISNSAAIIADAMHSLTDVANNGIAWLANNIAEQAPDNEHPYGHRKFEQLAVFFLASLLTIVAFELLLHAIKRFGEPVEQSFVGLFIMIFTLVANIGLTLWEQHWAKKLDSDILNADASHTFSDVLTTLVVIVGWQLAYYGYYWLDTVFAVAIAAVIFYLAFNLFRRAIPILVDQQRLDTQAVTDEIVKIHEVSSVLRVRSRFDGKKILADITVTVDPTTSTIESHVIADKIEELLAERFAAKDVMVHIEPKNKQ
ncbi:cation diffusion facilitator family transporter [Aliiglaciecola sp. LCG003]|uniref:cation diffusion facilitator family transporter n=1 Tax=Aliiglaciecola sp. LCG003 TaxID=3053655 RepID=UPI0025742F9B|nr:cation diffusion facilitator family transporter [Aliiglaciecola sp. LCG003]WJG10780.1 cation diffusion facilitator family transporter [Aliiglaciecola sp. LCG003]